MGKAKSFKDMEIWQLAREICKDIWVLTETIEIGKDFELRNQMNSSSGSIMDNIDEGFERNGNRGFPQFLSVS